MKLAFIIIPHETKMGSTKALLNNTINICDLSGFYNFIAETGFKGIVYYSGKLSQQILIRKKKIKYINMIFIQISCIKNHICIFS